MLHILHMYDFNSFLQECLAYLSNNLPDNLSPDPASPCFVMTWLKLADNLQLSELQELCMQKLRVFAHGKLIEGALLAPCKHAPVRMPRVPKPASCPNGHSGHNGQFSFGGPATHSYCPSWCNSCKAWVCCSNSLPGPSTSSSRQMFAASSAYGAESVTSCQVCGRGVHHEPPSEEVRWFSDDQPELTDGIKTLSRQALEELLVGVIAATCGSFSTGVRPHNQKQGTTKTK
ncbi:hypothetical protein CEUSTIGMA_g4555.t1 [Chlamydomonas eustigma]|uniref:Ig-like domain-containing protein n=1 Tax=Chlamydomonas eustigma TaxID=1157962 RepID=A0A250X2E4_9CHLO|nr:hypothetical protein CEUSTIGMA_g4555.t1 [Chlamydomonas eustigma]|eukprot:GAX77109.1 hypothetical protein CEUSTIGMA_g4555.t1 [Chlamydomonas eustigma]